VVALLFDRGAWWVVEQDFSLLDLLLRRFTGIRL
jgi:hypothetical protein